MPLSKYGHDLLLKITSSPPGQIDVKNIPVDQLDDVVDEVGSVLTFHKTLRLNTAITSGMPADELKAANILLDQVKQGILDGKATLARGPMGHVVTLHGIDSGSRSPEVHASVSQPWGVKVKSLRSWGITYGYRIWLNHAVIQDLAAGGAAAAAVLAWLPVAGWIVAAISVAVAVLKILDNGNGVYFYITFAGVWWVTSA